MSIIFKKKSPSTFKKNIFSKKGGSLNNRIDDLISEVIKEKIFNLLNINKKIYIKLVEYFPTYKLCEVSKEKTINAYMMRIKSSMDPRFVKLSAKEIELSGITLIEFDDFLELYGANFIQNKKRIENILNEI